MVDSGSWSLGGGVWNITVENETLIVEPGMGRKEWRLVLTRIKLECEMLEMELSEML